MARARRPKKKRVVIHWWRLDHASPDCECGYLPRQGQEHRQSSNRAHVTCKRCLAPRRCVRCREATKAWLSDVTDFLGRSWHRECAQLELAEQRQDVRR
jgi:hypothetical protein